MERVSTSMKNKLIILVIAAFAIVLEACGKQQKVTYENDNGFSITEMTFVSKEGQVIRRIAKNTIDY